MLFCFFSLINHDQIHFYHRFLNTVHCADGLRCYHDVTSSLIVVNRVWCATYLSFKITVTCFKNDQSVGDVMMADRLPDAETSVRIKGYDQGCHVYFLLLCYQSSSLSEHRPDGLQCLQYTFCLHSHKAFPCFSSKLRHRIPKEPMLTLLCIRSPLVRLILKKFFLTAASGR